MTRQRAASAAGRSGAGPGWSAAGVGAVAVGLVAVVVGLVGVDRHSLWRDEAATLVAGRRSLPELAAMLHHVDAVHGLYYALVHLWLTLGSGEVWLRLPSVLATGVAAGALVATGTWLAGLRTGVLAGLVLAALPVVSLYAQEARSYAMVSAAVVVATGCLVRAVAGDRRWWAGYAAAALLAVLLNELSGLALLAHTVSLAVGRVGRGAGRRWAVAVLPAMVALVPLGLASAAQSAQVGWLPRPSWPVGADLARLFLGPRPALLVGLPLLAVLGLLTARPGCGLDLPTVALPLLVLPPAVLLSVSLVHRLYYPRYVLYAVAGLALLAGGGLGWVAGRVGALLRRGTGTRGARVAGTAVAVVLLAVVVALELPQQAAVRGTGSRGDDLGGAAAVLRSHAEAGDSVLYVPSVYRFVGLAYPDAVAGLTDVGLTADPVAAQDLTGTDRTAAELVPALLAARRLWLVGPPTAPDPAMQAQAYAQRALVGRHFRRAAVFRVHGVDLVLYLPRHARAPAPPR